jgi:YYY domain-containing protein
VAIVVIWWLWMEVIGLAALPLAYRFFRRLPDRGYAFARPLGLLLTSYVLWMGSSLGLLRNSLGGALFSLALVAAASAVAYRRGRAADDLGLWAWLKAHGRLVLAVELLFAGALALWSLMRAYSPELTTAGGEKFMEIMYLNSIGRSGFFPPHDAWLSGYAISYYYLGYVMMATLTRLSGSAAHLTFNVGLALLFALTCTGAYGLVYNLVACAEKARHRRGTASAPPDAGPRAESVRHAKPLAYGLLGAVLVAVLGNLEGFLEVLYSLKALPYRFWQWLDIVGINQPFNPAQAPSLIPARSGWWWWQASRVINDLDPLGKPMGIEPIDEFPGFSFLLGDMHPHVLALPFVLLALAIALSALLQGSDEPDGTGPWWRPLRRLSILVPLCLGALGFLNTWDFPIYLGVFLAAYGLGQLRGAGRLSWALARDVGLVCLAVPILGVLLYLPFYIGFQSQAAGILPTLYVGTRFRHYFVIFGPFLAAVGGLLVVAGLQAARLGNGRRLAAGWARWTAAFLLVPLALMLAVALFMLVRPQGREFLEGLRALPFVHQIVGDDPWVAVLGKLLLVKLRTWVMPLVVAAMAALGVVLLQKLAWPQPASLPERDGGPDAENGAGKEVGEADLGLQFALLCAITGLLLTLCVEFVYLVDVFQVRMNTVFKFYFQAWVLLAIAAGFAVYWLGRQKGWLRSAFLAGFWLLFALGMVYPILGNISRAGNFDHPPTLDGTAYLADSQPDDHAALAWLNQEIGGAPVILEAPATGGSSYVYEGRVSALTGLPTLLGWAGHEGQWRGSYAIQSAREPDIQTIYMTLSPEQALDLLHKYDVQYVYVGPLERSKYDAKGLAKFDQMMDVVYQNDGVTIYRVSQ